MLLLSGLWGRVLTSGSGSLLVTIVVSLVIGFLEITLRLSSGQRDKFFLTILKGKKAAEELHAASSDIRGSWVILDLILENICVISASFVQYLYSITPSGEAVTVSRLAINIFSQLAIELVVGFFCLKVEAKHGVPVAKAWHQRFGGSPRDKKEFFQALFVVSVITFTFFIGNIASTKGGFIVFRDTVKGG